mgnify:CR=1 FL=1
MGCSIRRALARNSNDGIAVIGIKAFFFINLQALARLRYGARHARRTRNLPGREYFALRTAGAGNAPANSSQSGLVS